MPAKKTAGCTQITYHASCAHNQPDTQGAAARQQVLHGRTPQDLHDWHTGRGAGSSRRRGARSLCLLHPPQGDFCRGHIRQVCELEPKHGGQGGPVARIRGKDVPSEGSGELGGSGAAPPRPAPHRLDDAGGCRSGCINNESFDSVEVCLDLQ